ncbi:MarR family winged helix-turn-helix transcriptional regulator [Glutamicibacter sp. AOP5-A2-18]|uniref:MarR family winged helix-turn-helix transcriptional regulator n=1 Tax=Glutamicibacter sp. AOP5-A2-18 TaxID=3457656 RepID=UPI004034AEFC
MSDAPTDSKSVAADVAHASGTMSRLLGQSAGQGRSVTAWRVLSSLDRLGAQRVGDLAIEQRVAQPTMTGLVIRLEKDRMVKRQDDPKDRRASLVNLTKAGRREIEGYRERAMNVLLGGIEGFSEEDQRVLARAVALLQQLNNQIAAGLDS